MQHSLWVIGDNRIVALNEIRNVTPCEEGSIIYFKDGTKEKISADDTGNLVKAVMMTQKVGDKMQQRNHRNNRDNRHNGDWNND